jgi:FkbM family methyltransferase
MPANMPLLHNPWTILRASRRKLGALIKREADVSSSCQIPNLREIYRRADLSDHSGFFVEIGAFDGESFSNTSFLADQGWRGIYFEPVPQFAQRARERHIFNKISVINVAISATEGSLPMYVMDSLSTTKAQNYDLYQNLAWARPVARAAIIQHTISMSLQNAFAVARVPYRFDLLVVDTEGAEEEVVAMFLSSPYRCQVLVIELEDNHPDIASLPAMAESHRRARAAIENAGYHEIYKDDINSIFVDLRGNARKSTRIETDCA